jgi:hypothetical protein
LGVRGPLRLGLVALLLTSALAGAEPQLPPAIVVLVLDTSGSLSPRDVDGARQLGLGILHALPPGSEAAVIAFADESRILLERTADPAAVEKAIASLRPGGRRTALHDALFDASRYLRDAPATRRAIVLLTDGRDTGSALSVEDGLKVAQETRIPVFCVGVGKVDERVLRRIAKLTSGDYTPMAETTGGTLASRIFEAATLAVPKEEPTPLETARPAPVPKPAQPPVTAPGTGQGQRTRLLAVLLVALAVLIAAFLILRARRPSVSSSSSKSRYPPTLREGARGDGGGEEDVPETLFSRMDLGGEGVGGTLVLHEQPTLEVTAGPGKGRSFSLSSASATSVGRARANDVVLEDDSVSSQHARIRPEDGGFVLHDLGSTNGTRVNDRKVSRHLLQDGDVIRMGDTSLRFRLRESR